MIIAMNQREPHRLETLNKVLDNHLSKVDAAQLLNLSIRQLYRLINRFKSEGVTGLASKKRGKPSNNKLPTSITKKALKLIRNHYEDFGPTLACEKFLETHKIDLSVETVRKLMISDEIWLTRKQRQAKVYQPRYQRDCYGELIRVDGSDHDELV